MHFMSRAFLLIITALLLTAAQVPVFGASDQLPVFQGERTFDRLRDKATSQNWSTLPIGELMGKIAKELEGTPYVGNTLELSKDQEVCSVNLDQLDCVT